MAAEGQVSSMEEIPAKEHQEDTMGTMGECGRGGPSVSSIIMVRTQRRERWSWEENGFLGSLWNSGCKALAHLSWEDEVL